MSIVRLIGCDSWVSELVRPFGLVLCGLVVGCAGGETGDAPSDLLVESEEEISAEAPSDATMGQYGLFNRPLGSGTEQNAIIDHLIGLIDNTPTGAWIRAGYFSFTHAKIRDALARAVCRGVVVRVVIDEFGEANDDGQCVWGPSGSLPSCTNYNRVAAASLDSSQHRGLEYYVKSNVSLTAAECTDLLGQASAGVTCSSCSFTRCGLGRPGQACISSHPGGIQHEKYMMFSTTYHPTTGKKLWRTVVVTSSNMTYVAATKQWNNAVVMYGDLSFYDAWVDHFNAQRAGNPIGDYYDPNATPPGGYYQSPETYYTVYHSPEQDTDLIANRMIAARIPGDGATLSGTGCRLWVNHADVNDTRMAVADELIRIKKAGCDVRVIYGDMESGVAAALDAAKVPRRQAKRPEASSNGDVVFTHNKYVVYRGPYDGEAAKTRVWAGSQNLTGAALRENDEVLLKLGQESVAAAYEDHFRAMWLAYGNFAGLDESLVPVELKAYTGGKDIALTWERANETAVSSYNVYRDGMLIGTAQPHDPTSWYAHTASYVDRTVANDVPYSYQLQAVSAGGVKSALTKAVKITHDTSGVPVPAITVDASAAPTYVDYLNNGKKILQTWYPKVANRIARPEYTPPSSLTLKFVTSNCAGAGWVGGSPNTINICADVPKNSPNEVTIFVHEATHVIQGYSGYAPGMITEGIASWGGDLSVGYRQPKPGFNNVYSQGYGVAEYFLNWIADTYHVPTLVHDVNVQAHRGTYKDTFFQTAVGRSVGQLWTEMTGRTTSSPGALKGPGGKCIDLDMANSRNGNPFKLLGCYEGDAQKFVFQSNQSSDGYGRLLMMGKCVTASTQLVISDCVGSDAQTWRFTGGQLQNLSTGGCLQPKSGSTTDGTLLVTAPCTTTTLQQWSALPN